MTHRLNTNKQFMIGNGILAFAVIFVVVLFVYMSMRLQNDENRRYAEHYTVPLVKGVEGAYCGTRTSTVRHSTSKCDAWPKKVP